MGSRGILWILGRVQLAELFDTVMIMERGKLDLPSPYDEIQSTNEHFQQLLETE